MTPRTTRFALLLACGGLLVAGVLRDAGADPGQETSADAAQAAKDEKREPLRLRYLANEGFLVEVGEHAVLFDAFVGMPYAGYPSMPEDLVDALRHAEEPFDGIDLALTSHAHADHFQERVARDFLVASPETAFASTKQAKRALEGLGTELEARVVGRYPKKGKVEEERFGDLTVRFLRVPHGGMPDVENLGTLLTIGGHVVLHLGDADVDASLFEPYAKQLADVDLALVPHWFYSTAKGRKIVEEHLPAKAHVAMHFARRRLSAVVESFLENHEGVHAFSEPLDEKTFE